MSAFPEIFEMLSVLY